MALVHSILMGALAGMRSMTPLAAVASAARTSTLPTDNGAPELLAARFASMGMLALAAGELLGDKMESAPDRTVPAGMMARIVSGAIAGAALAPRRQREVGALLGASVAVAAAYLSLDLRMRAMQRYGQAATGAVEDALAVSGAALIVRSAARS